MAGEGDLVAGFEDLLLTVEGKMIAVFADDDGSEQAGGGEAGVLQGGERSDDGRGFRLVLPDVFAPDEVAAEKTARGVVKLLGDFLTDAAPALRILLYGFRINDLIRCRSPLRGCPVDSLSTLRSGSSTTGRCSGSRGRRAGLTGRMV